MAGVTVAALALPSAVAYAELAGLSPVVGLYALLAPPIAYALLGSSRQLIVGPKGSIAALVATAILPLAAGNADRYASLAALVALLVGGVFLAARVFRLGWVADYFSRAVLIGYIHGVAIVLALSQLGKLFGLDIEAHDPVPQLAEFVDEIAGSSGPTSVVAAACLAPLLTLRVVSPNLPAALLVAASAIALSAALSLESSGVAIVGKIGSGLPGVGIPAWQLGDAVGLLPAALGIFVVSFADEILTARSFAGKHGQHVRANQELFAMGFANIAAGFTHAFPIGASGSRTAVNDQSGARTRLSGLVSVAAVGVVLLFLTAPL